MIKSSTLSYCLRAPLLAATLLSASPVFADHPGENLNEVMASKESAFEPLAPQDAPDVAWTGAGGETLSLEAMMGRIVVLSFVPGDCGRPCELQQEKLGETVAALNASAMRKMVAIVTLSDDPQSDPDAQNWTSARVTDPARLADAAMIFATASERERGPMLHLLNRKNQQVGIFHGVEFDPMNLLLYINGLTNAHPHAEPGIWQRLIDWFS